MKDQKTYSGFEAIEALKQGKTLVCVQFRNSKVFYEASVSKDHIMYSTDGGYEWTVSTLSLEGFMTIEFTEYNEYNLSGKDAIQALIDGHTLIDAKKHRVKYSNGCFMRKLYRDTDYFEIHTMSNWLNDKEFYKIHK